MKKYIATAFCLLFISPWIHRLAYENLILAVPDIKGDAHSWVIGLTGAIVFILLVYKSMNAN